MNFILQYILSLMKSNSTHTQNKKTWIFQFTIFCTSCICNFKILKRKNIVWFIFWYISFSLDDATEAKLKNWVLSYVEITKSRRFSCQVAVIASSSHRAKVSTSEDVLNGLLTRAIYRLHYWKLWTSWLNYSIPPLIKTTFNVNSSFQMSPKDPYLRI